MKAFIRNIQCDDHVTALTKFRLWLNKDLRVLKHNIDLGEEGWGFAGGGDWYVHYAKKGPFYGSVSTLLSFIVDYKWTYKLTRAATLVKWKPLLKVMFESPLSVILSTVHHFYSLYHKVPASNTSIQITIKELHLHAYMLQSYVTSYKTENINIYIPSDNHTETVLRFRTQHGLHSSLRICYE